MLDMGFMDEIDAILAYLPPKRQTLLFSATYPEAIAGISRRVQFEPRTVDVTDDELPAQITQTWCSVTRDNRNVELVRTLRAWGGALNLVFCNTKVDCAEVARHLQSENAVFNYELPQQPEVYVHRIGRTGRAGKTGIAVSLVEEREMWRLQEIEKSLPDALIQQRGIPDARRGDETLVPLMTTIQISGGRKNKLRPGDLLGALTAQGGIPGDAVGKIDLADNVSYVAVQNKHVS
jgi:ATP-independent RNA helicase DbpA